MAKYKSLTNIFYANEIAQIRWFGFMKEIVNIGNNFELCA